MSRKEVITAIITSAQDAILAKVEELNKQDEANAVTGDEVISAYVTMCRSALVVSQRYGADPQKLIDALNLIVLELSPTKGQPA